MEVDEVMKRFGFLMILGLMAITLLVGCGDKQTKIEDEVLPTPPSAEFSGTPTAGIADLTVNFIDMSTNTPTTWSWDFGDGSTAIEKSPSHTYAAAGTYTVALTVTNADGTDTETKAAYITVQPKPIPKLVESQLQTVYFDFDKFNLRSDAKAALDANYALLTEFADAMVQIEGHCDERGTTEYNMSLGEKRANAARDYLIGLGIADNRLSTISYGEERPAVQGSTEAAWDKNRRGEFKIVSQ